MKISMKSELCKATIAESKYKHGAGHEHNGTHLKHQEFLFHREKEKKPFWPSTKGKSPGLPYNYSKLKGFAYQCKMH